MAKYTNDLVLDEACNKIATATLLSVCEGQPLNRTEAVTAKGSGGKSLGTVVVDGADFTVSDGTVSGRRVDVGAQAGITASDAGNGDHVALCDATDLLNVTTAPTQAVSAGGNIDVATYGVEFRDPS